MSIRSTFAPERVRGLAMFSAWIVEFSRGREDFAPVANYAISYLGRYQNADPRQWFETCNELYDQFIQRPPPFIPPASPYPRSASPSSEPTGRGASMPPHGALTHHLPDSASKTHFGSIVSQKSFLAGVRPLSKANTSTNSIVTIETVPTTSAPSSRFNIGSKRGLRYHVYEVLRPARDGCPPTEARKASG
jgi:hypothetical protein